MEEHKETSVDAQIDHAAAVAYWSATDATVDGVLGGFPQVSRVDLQGSRNFLVKLRRKSKQFPPKQQLNRVVDCGAGIGRITDGLLCDIANIVDIVEPVKKFTDQVQSSNVGKIYNVGLEQWTPEEQYDLIWNQWCLSQITDVQVVEYLQRLVPSLTEGGWIVVKENISNDLYGQDIYDDTDSSVTRTDVKFKELFNKADLRLLSTELQRGLPKVSAVIAIHEK